MEPDDEVFQQQLAVAKNDHMMAKWTLRDLCLKAVIRHKLVLNQISESSGQLRVDNLPSVLKDDLFTLMSHEITRVHLEERICQEPCSAADDCAFFVSLLHPNVKVYYLPRCFRSETTSRELNFKLMDALALTCKELPMFVAAPPDFESDFQWFDQRVLELVPQLANLQVLKLLDTGVSDPDLLQISRNCPKLVVIQVGYMTQEATRDGIEALSTLAHLKKFLFDCGRKQAKRFLLLFAELIPHLQMLAWAEIVDHEPDRATPTYHQLLVEQEQPVPLGIQLLILSRQVRLHPTCHLPELKALHLVEPKGDILQLCNRFNTFSELTIHVASNIQVKVMLQEVGRRLEKLELRHITPTSLKDVMEFCPNLRSLKIFGCSKLEVDPIKGSTANSFKSLERVDLCFSTVPLPRGFLKQLFCAPNLKELKMTDIYPTEIEINEIMELVEQRFVLRELSLLKWYNYRYYPEAMKPWMAEKAHFHLLLDTIRIYFPHLEIIENTFNRQEPYAVEDNEQDSEDEEEEEVFELESERDTEEEEDSQDF